MINLLLGVAHAIALFIMALVVYLNILEHGLIGALAPIGSAIFGGFIVTCFAMLLLGLSIHYLNKAGKNDR